MFDRSALLELRRAARLQSVFKTSFSRLNPVPRGQATVIRSSVRSLQRRPTTRDKPLAQFTLTIQSDKLPSYLRPLLRFQPARPSTISSGPGSDVLGLNPKHLEASRSIFSSQCMQNTHQTLRVDAKPFFSRRQLPSVSTPIDLVELSGIEPLTPCLQSRCSPS